MEFIKKLKLLFKENNIEIIDYKGEKESITYKCLDCGQIYTFKCARNLIPRITLCKKCYNPFSKWDAESFFNLKLKRVYPDSEIELIDFKSIRHGGKVKCNKCGKIEKINNFEALLAARKDNFCNNCEKEKNIIFEHLQKELKKGYLKLIAWNGVNTEAEFKCLRCGHIFKKYVKKNFNGKICPNCFKVINKFSFKEGQEILDKKGNNEYQLLQFKGMNKRSLIKHKCGFCYTTRLSDFEKTRGCPKCYRKISKGE